MDTAVTVGNTGQVNCVIRTVTPIAISAGAARSSADDGGEFSGNVCIAAFAEILKSYLHLDWRPFVRLENSDCRMCADY